MISLEKCNGSFNVIDDLSTKLCVPSKTKDISIILLFIIAIIYYNYTKHRSKQKRRISVLKI